MKTSKQIKIENPRHAKKAQAVSPSVHPWSSCCLLAKSPASSFFPVCNHYYHCQHCQHFHYYVSSYYLACNQEYLLVVALVVVVMVVGYYDGGRSDDHDADH